MAKVAVIGIASVVLVAMVVAVAVTVNNNNKASDKGKDAGGGSGGDSGGLKTSVKAVEQICQPTDYKQACVDNISKSAGNVTDPKELVQVAFKVAGEHIKEAAKRSETIQTLAKDPMTTQALQNCRELFEYAMDELKRSIEEMGNIDITKMDDLTNDLKVWLSAAVTYQETCLDGFQNTTGDAGEQMRKALKLSGELTSNTLAIVNEVSSFVTSLDTPKTTRRLLTNEEEQMTIEDGFPTWVNHHKRRLLQEALPANLKPNVVVAKDGSGKYKTIKEAINEIPKANKQAFIIYVKAGVYEENLLFDKTATNVMLIGDGPTKTRITGNKSFGDGTATFKTATVAVVGNFFIAKGVGFENSAGAVKHQAVALRVQSDKSVFYNCQFDGYQDTLYTHTNRQFYRDCTISGTIDFIFGDAAVVFQNCKILIRKPMDNQQCIIAASGRKDKRQATGIVLQGCTISADPTLVPVKNTIKSYLARPWKAYARTIVIQSQIDDVIDPEGFLPWRGTAFLDTLFYSELNNKGPGADTSKRVKWAGIKTINAQHALDFTPSKFIIGDEWIKPTGVPYSPGMMST